MSLGPEGIDRIPEIRISVQIDPSDILDSDSDDFQKIEIKNLENISSGKTPSLPSDMIFAKNETINSNMSSEQ